MTLIKFSLNLRIPCQSNSFYFPWKFRSSAWHLPFILKVNGSLITPPSINSTTFETTFNATSQWKQKFTLVHTDEVTDGNKVFSVHFNHKVSEPAKEEIKKAIIATFVQQHPGMFYCNSFVSVKLAF